MNLCYKIEARNAIFGPIATKASEMTSSGKRCRESFFITQLTPITIAYKLKLNPKTVRRNFDFHVTFWGVAGVPMEASS